MITDVLRVKPILSTGPDGSMKPAGIIFGSKNRPKKLARFVMNEHVLSKKYRILIGHANCEEDAHTLMDYIKKGFKNIESIDLLEIGSALGVHTGPGALLVGIQKYKENT